MFRNIVFSAFGAAIAICVALSVLQAFTTEPLILHAEEFEGAAAPHDHEAAGLTSIFSALIAAHAHEATDAVAEAEEWGPADGFERSFFTVLANLVIGFAVSLMVLAVMVIRGGPIDARTGLLWGVAGFFAVSLLPSLGLPPELPGTPAADIVERQTWWLFAAIASAGGIAAIVFGREWWLIAAGVVVVLLPHIFGAPVPPSHEVAYPGALAGEFVIASLVVGATLWLIAGTASGWLYQRLSARG
jgi:cobalt transporter subunit CbtA